MYLYQRIAKVYYLSVNLLLKPIFTPMIYKFFALTLLCVLTASCQDQQSKTNTTDGFAVTTATYFLIRHAEKQGGSDPELTEAGKERAAFWADYLSSEDVDLVYSTDTKRTMATASPIAQANNLTVQTYKPNSLFDTGFAKATEGKTVVIVGHSNTAPFLVNDMLGEDRYEEIDESQYGTIYKVVVKNGKTSASMKTINN